METISNILTIWFIVFVCLLWQWFMIATRKPIEEPHTRETMLALAFHAFTWPVAAFAWFLGAVGLPLGLEEKRQLFVDKVSAWFDRKLAFYHGEAGG